MLIVNLVRGLLIVDLVPHLNRLPHPGNLLVLSDATFLAFVHASSLRCIALGCKTDFVVLGNEGYSWASCLRSSIRGFRLSGESRLKDRASPNSSRMKIWVRSIS